MGFARVFDRERRRLNPLIARSREVISSQHASNTSPCLRIALTNQFVRVIQASKHTASQSWKQRYQWRSKMLSYRRRSTFEWMVFQSLCGDTKPGMIQDQRNWCSGSACTLPDTGSSQDTKRQSHSAEISWKSTRDRISTRICEWRIINNTAHGRSMKLSISNLIQSHAFIGHRGYLVLIPYVELDTSSLWKVTTYPKTLLGHQELESDPSEALSSQKLVNWAPSFNKSIESKRTSGNADKSRELPYRRVIVWSKLRSKDHRELSEHGNHGFTKGNAMIMLSTARLISASGVSWASAQVDTCNVQIHECPHHKCR